MSYIDAIPYIKKQKSQGVTKEKITEALKTVGWHDADINKAFMMEASPQTPVSTNSSVSSEIHNSYAVTALVLGICSMFFSFIIFVPIAGIVFGILALKRPGGKTQAIWGLCLSGVGLLWGIVICALFAFGFFSSLNYMY